MKKHLLFIFLFVNSIAAFGTHNRAGEIIYRRISGFTYEATVITYTMESSPADRNTLELYWGDGDSNRVVRENGPDINPGDQFPDGEIVGNDIKKNIYRGTHTYSGGGDYWVSMEDPNRNEGVINIPSSVSKVFYIRSLLKINAILGKNTSPVLLNPPIDEACANKLFIHNPGAFDIDGDSLSYELAICLGADGLPIPGFFIPFATKSVSVNAYTGDFIWDYPLTIGEFNIAILIKEWREGFLIGSILRDMQINVVGCSNNPPEIVHVRDTCVEAGKTVSFPVTALDRDHDRVILIATGGPFSSNPPAKFISPTPKDTVRSIFSWQTTCDEVQKQAYQITFKANDLVSEHSLVDFETVQITIVGPAPINTKAAPSGSSIVLSWDPSSCKKAIGYYIYRKNGFLGWTPGPCETGVPDYTGYKIIGMVNGLNNTQFTDNEDGQGLIHGIDYCYMIVAFYPDGAQSYASAEFCAQLVKDVPIITNVSIVNTDTSKGVLQIKWIKPIADIKNLDTIANPGPYEFRLLQAEGFYGTLFSPIKSFSSPFFASLLDTAYTVNNLNTLNKSYRYRIDFYTNNQFKGSTHLASSVYLSITPSDNKLSLSWEEHVPWFNTKYVIFKKNNLDLFEPFDTTTFHTYLDSNLINGTNYCYKIESIGAYSDSSIVAPLRNYSEEKCAMPKDLLSPCPPVLSGVPDCNLSQIIFNWTDPNHYCADDAVAYKIYYTPVQGEEYKLLKSITTTSDTSYIFSNSSSIAGCFVVTAIDSFNNESAFSNSICIDNCPVYDLPNVFSPGSDGINDLFIPFPYKYIKSIDIKIYDRWGMIIFETTDPDIKWNGINQQTKQLSAEDVFYYVCVVNEIRVNGIQQKVYKGFVHLFYDPVPQSNK